MATIELDKKIKQAVQTWRDRNYEGVSPVTKRLLEFWFKEEHLLEDGTCFKFWRCQRDAIETLIYIYEVCKCTSLYDLARSFGVSLPVDPTKDLWPKYCFKMATGSGKTFVMTFALLWQHFNKTFGTENGLRYSSHFLLLAPNIIVYDRLCEAFENNQIFRDYPFIPQEWKSDFDLQLILQSETTPAHSRGILHLTNIQQLYERADAEGQNPIAELVGPKPKSGEEVFYEGLLNALQGYDDLGVMNDEAHHVHSDDLQWNKCIATLDSGLKENFGNELTMQLDFSATPKDLEGRLFPHIVYDYPLAEAIIDRIVKRVRIGEIENIPEPTTKDFVKRHELQIDTGVRLLKEFQKEFKESKKKPILFIMTDNTRNADKVGSYLERGEFSGKVLVIHTDVTGGITKKDLEKAREAAREVDHPDNPYEIIISVMMLKEGWDVKSVCVIVPLRAFDSPVLPEQTLGRGLRRMFPNEDSLLERVIVIDHPRFRQLWQAEIDAGELVADFTSANNAYEPINAIFVDPQKLQYDMEIPTIEGGEQRVAPRISLLQVETLPRKQFVFSDIEIPKVMYKEKDLLEQKIVRQKELSFEYTDNAQLYLSYLTKAILSKIGASAVFSELLPKVKDYVENFLFDQEINLEDNLT
ncbi:MAG: DEAD/DEAH box helicase family protein, partial [Candidatus Brocadiaceae bacterium]|nr:DEAD/DEAH box helicase family protein [Candidatus Brocadiaceae bacterium]